MGRRRGLHPSGGRSEQGWPGRGARRHRLVLPAVPGRLHHLRRLTMADWPEAAELEKYLDLSNDPASWTDQVERIMSAAIARVKGDVGQWDELVDEPDEALAQ